MNPVADIKINFSGYRRWRSTIFGYFFLENTIQRGKLGADNDAEGFSKRVF